MKLERDGTEVGVGRGVRGISSGRKFTSGSIGPWYTQR